MIRRFFACRAFIRAENAYQKFMKQPAKGSNWSFEHASMLQRRRNIALKRYFACH